MEFEQFKEEYIGQLKQALREEGNFSEVALQKFYKTNVVKEGINVDLGNKQGMHALPTMYMEDLYQDYQTGKSMERIVEMSVDNLLKRSKVVDGFMDYLKPDYVVPTFVNMDLNREMLQTHPHIPYEDLSIIFRIKFPEEVMEGASARVTEQMLETWDISVQELYELTLKNQKNMDSIKILTMNEIIGGMTGLESPEMESIDTMYVITNEDKYFGAASILYKDKMQELSEKLGTDLYILPSSVHEVIAISVQSCMADVEGLEAMVRDINQQQVEPEERLSDHVYRYDSKERVVTLASNQSVMEKTGRDKESPIR